MTRHTHLLQNFRQNIFEGEGVQSSKHGELVRACAQLERRVNEDFGFKSRFFWSVMTNM